MSVPTQPVTTRFYSSVFLPMLVYAVCIWWWVCPMGFDIRTDLIGYLGSDTLDTLSLRWAFWHQDSHFAPLGWDAMRVTPNFLDHLFFYPLLSLPFPLADNIWWLSQLWLSMLLADAFGRQLAPQSPPAGWLSGFTLLCVDTIVRDINWGHSPQVMWWAPLGTLLFLIKWCNTSRQRDLLVSGLLLAISGWCYFFFVPFLFLMTLPLWWAQGQSNRQAFPSFLQWSVVGLLFLAPNIWFLYTHSTQMTAIPTPPLVNGQTLTDIHSATFKTLLSGTPIDISNLFSIIWCIVVGWGGYHAWIKRRFHFWWGLWMVILGISLIFGTNGFLFGGIQHLPFMSRLLWPERFGILLVLGAIPWLVHTRGLWWLLPLMLVEQRVRSHNLPLHTESMTPWLCLSTLQDQEGIVLELPLKDSDPLYNQQSLRQRIHQRPLLNPLILPPFIDPPQGWRSIPFRPEIQAVDGERTFSNEHLEVLQDLGITSILVDTIALPTNRQNRIINHLSPVLGEPLNLGCGLVWVLDQSTLSAIPSLTVTTTPEITIPSTQEPWYIGHPSTSSKE